MKNKNLIFGLIIGFGAFYLFEKVGKKDCGCHDAGTGDENLETELLEPNPPNAGGNKREPTCEEAVAMIMSELRKTSRMSEAGFQQREAQELARCKKMSSERR